MRATKVLLSGPITQSGHHSGLHFIKGHITYTLSPMHQKFFGGFLGNIIPEVSTRTLDFLKLWGAPLATIYYVRYWANKTSREEEKKATWS